MDINCILSYDVASGSEITPCNKIDKPLVAYRFRETLWIDALNMSNVSHIAKP